MLRIAICDDEGAQLQLTQSLVYAYASAKNLVIKVHSFSSAHELLNAITETGPFDLYILDIVMPQMSGIDLGLQIRKTDCRNPIVYLSSSPDYALESYQVHAFYYLLKPVSRETLFHVLDDAVTTLTRQREEGIQVKTHDGTIRLLFDSILYAELQNRVIRYHLRDNGFVDSMTLVIPFREAIAPLLIDKRFFSCGASFVVNLHFIKMVDKNGVVFLSNERLTLPKATCTPLRNAWSDYWLEGGTF